MGIAMGKEAEEFAEFILAQLPSLICEIKATPEELEQYYDESAMIRHAIKMVITKWKKSLEAGASS